MRNLYAGQEATAIIRHGATDWFQNEKAAYCHPVDMHIKAAYCHPVDLSYMQSTSCEMPGWMKHKLESRLPEETLETSGMQMTPPLWQNVKRNYRTSW